MLSVLGILTGWYTSFLKQPPEPTACWPTPAIPSGRDVPRPPAKDISPLPSQAWTPQEPSEEALYCEGEGLGCCWSWGFFGVTLNVGGFFKWPFFMGEVKWPPFFCDEKGSLGRSWGLLICPLSHFLVGFVQKRGGVQVGFGTWLGQVYPRSTLYVNNLGIYFHDGKELEIRGGIGHHHM